MGTTRIKPAAYQRNAGLRIALQEPVFCFAGFACGLYLSFDDAARLTGDRGIDQAMGPGERISDQRQIVFLDALFDEFSLNLREFGKITNPDV